MLFVASEEPPPVQSGSGEHTPRGLMRRIPVWLGRDSLELASGR
jgi:hypothetical protein